jgi:hypothetical protein
MSQDSRVINVTGYVQHIRGSIPIKVRVFPLFQRGKAGSGSIQSSI